MNKILLVLVAGLSLSTLQAQHMLLRLQDKTAEHQAAYNDFAPWANQLGHTATITNVSQSGNQTTVTTEYKYHIKDAHNPHVRNRLSDDQGNALVRYREAVSALRNTLAPKAAGDGFITGAITAGVAHLLARPSLVLPLAGLGALAACALLVRYNKQQPVTPYFERPTYKRHENIFANVSFDNAGKLGLALCSSLCAYYGVSYTIARLTTGI